MFVWVPQSSWVLPVSVTLTSEDPAYPAGRTVVYDSHPYLRTSRTLNISGNKFLTFDYGEIKTFAGFAVINTNVVSMGVQQSTDGFVANAVHLTGSPYTVGAHRGIRRICRLVDWTTRYNRLFIAPQTPSDNAAYYENGCVIFFSSYFLLPENPDEGAGHPIRREYEEVGNVVNPLSPLPFSEATWRYERIHDELTQLYSMAEGGRRDPFLVFENEGNDAAVFVMRLREDVDFSLSSTSQIVSLGLKEVV